MSYPACAPQALLFHSEEKAARVLAGLYVYGRRFSRRQVPSVRPRMDGIPFAICPNSSLSRRLRLDRVLVLAGMRAMEKEKGKSRQATGQ